jgi:hypothetical protein
MSNEAPVLEKMEKAEEAALIDCWNISQPSAINAHCRKAAALAFIDHYSDPANHEKFVERLWRRRCELSTW